MRAYINRWKKSGKIRDKLSEKKQSDKSEKMVYSSYIHDFCRIEQFYPLVLNLSNKMVKSLRKCVMNEQIYDKFGYVKSYSSVDKTLNPFYNM